MADGLMEAPPSDVRLSAPDLHDPLGSLQFVKGTEYMDALARLGYNVENMTSPIPLMTKIAEAGSNLLDMGMQRRLENQKAQADLAYKTAQTRYTDSEAANNETLLGSRLKLLDNQADEAAAKAKVASSTVDDQIAISGMNRQAAQLALQQQKDGIEKGNAAQIKWESEYKNFPSGLNNPDYPTQRDQWYEKNGDLVLNPATAKQVAAWRAQQDEIYGRQADAQVRGALLAEVTKGQAEGDISLHQPKPVDQMNSDELKDLVVKKNLKLTLGRMRSALSTLPEVPQQLGDEDRANDEQRSLRTRLSNASDQLESYLRTDDSLKLIKGGQMPNVNANGVETDDYARVLSDYQTYTTRAAAAQAVTNPEVTIKTIPQKGKEGESIEFKMPFDEAFRRGLIDAQGNQIKAPAAQPMSEEEKGFRAQQAQNAIRAEPGNEGVRRVAEAYAQGKITPAQFTEQLSVFKRTRPRADTTPEYVGQSGGQFGGLVTPGGINGPQAGLGRARGGLISPTAATAGYGQGYQEGGRVSADSGGLMQASYSPGVEDRLPGTEPVIPRQTQNAARAEMIYRGFEGQPAYTGGGNVVTSPQNLIDWHNFNFGNVQSFSDGSGFYSNPETDKPYNLKDEALVGARVPMSELTRVLGTDAGSEKSVVSREVGRGLYQLLVVKKDGTAVRMPVVDVTPEGKGRGLELTPAAMKMIGFKPGEQLGYRLAFPDGSNIEPSFGGQSPIHDWLRQRDMSRRQAPGTITMQGGGVVPGYQNGGTVNPLLGANADVAPNLTLGSTDTVSAMLSPGEFVLNAGAVKDIGLPMLEALNQSPASDTAQSDVTNVATPLLLGEAAQAPPQMTGQSPIALPPVAQPGSGGEWPHVAPSPPQTQVQALAPRAEIAAPPVPAQTPAVTTGPATVDINKPLVSTGAPIGTEITGLATNFGHDVNGRPDTYMLSKLGPGARIGAFGTDVVNPSTVGVSLPVATIRANIGDPTNPAVRKAIQSGRYQVLVHAPNGRSGMFKIVDIGPGPNEPGKIDLTGSAMRQLGVNDSFNARFQVVDTQAPTRTYQSGGFVASGLTPAPLPYSDRRTAVQSLM